jgi:hypothetical protein
LRLVKIENQQASPMLYRTRGLVMRQRTQVDRFGARPRRQLNVVAARGRNGLKTLIATIMDEKGKCLPDAMPVGARWRGFSSY